MIVVVVIVRLFDFIVSYFIFSYLNQVTPKKQGASNQMQSVLNQLVVEACGSSENGLDCDGSDVNGNALNPSNSSAER